MNFEVKTMRKLLIHLFIGLFIIEYPILNAQSYLERIILFSKGYTGSACLNNKDNSLLVSYFKVQGTEEEGIYWYKNNKIRKKIINVSMGSISPDGNYYTYLNKSGNKIFIFEENNTIR